METDLRSAGGDAFIFAMQLDGKGGGNSVAANAITPGTSWVHVDYSATGVHELLAGIEISEHAVETLTRLDTRPRALRMDGGVVLSLRAVNLNPTEDPEDMVSLRLWIEPTRIVSVRQRKLFSIQDVRADLETGKGPKSAIEIVSAVVERIADRVADFVERLEQEIDEYELAIERPELGDLRSRVSNTRREIAQVRRYLAPQREALEALCRDAEEWLRPEVHSFREQSDRLIRDVEELDLSRERLLVLQEEILNRTAQEQNARMYVLSIVAVIFLPITFVTGLFGMNVGGLPGTTEGSAFWIVAAIMAVASLGIMIWLRLKRWL